MFEKIKKNINKIKNEIIKPDDRAWKKLYGEYPDTLTYFDGSIYEYMSERRKEYENLIALEYFNNSISYKKMMHEIDQCASALVKNGIKENDVVSICMANTPEAVIAFYAINKIGAVANMIHPLSSENELKIFINDAESKLVFINDIILDKIKEIERELISDKIVIVPISNKMDFITKTLYNLTTKNKIKENDLNERYSLWNTFVNTSIIDTLVHRTPNDDAVILYSGGTTGKSKGVVLSNLNFNAITIHCKAMIPYTVPGNSILSYLPIFHGFGLGISINAPLCMGMKCILIPKINTKKVNKLIKTKKPNFLPAIPSLLNFIIKDTRLDKNAFKSVLTILSGGDFLSLDLKDKTEEYFRNHGSNATIRIGYGLTESTASASVSLVENYKKGSIGIPFPDNYFKIVKTNTHITADVNEIGEICISGPTVMKRYLNNEEETFKTLRLHEDGRLWLHTGDLGYMDEEGVFFFSTRLKRVIISNGMNIYPGELEEIFNNHPYIESAVVIGISDEVKVQTVKAIFVLKQEIKLSEKVKNEIKEYAKKNIAKYALPKTYEFIKELPKTKIGKIDYRKLEN